MTRMTRLRLLLLGLLLSLAGLPASLAAHPHAWIDLAITLERDRHGHITHMHHSWRFDPTYGQYLYEDAQEHQPGDTPAQRLQGMAREIHANLSEYHWYSHVEAGGDPVAVEPAGEPEMIHEDHTLFLRFRLALEEPVDTRGTALHYKVYDPTYFIEILHRQPHGTRVLGPGGIAAPGCRVELTQPRPDPAMVARAMALDYGATAEYDLGRHFAEQVRVRCDE